ncbi:amino acid ABC transporter permease [Herbinix luporum]|uniref:Putative membrane protein n=1 Tax=Herbinix luporum TaxID=1679721 RepID=A0A0K8J805_9FIRM|nr:amino acid ABC transporter permease [Herbinix luporum]MDI9488427.1 amino acid ABC transporter permease [Bacillota bacterium]CUH93700.1 putative membrane protein [Herbinix luporum]
MYLSATWFKEIYSSFYKALIPEQRYLAYLDGLKVTLLISFFAIILGILIGVLVAVLNVTSINYKMKWLSSLCNIYINVIRGTPVMVQLLIIYNLIFTSRDSNEILIGAVCFGINSGAYVSEIIRAGIDSIDKGQMEAGRSLGMSYVQTMVMIILPQAVRNILPALGNEFIILIKETSVASVIAITDLTQAAQYIGSRTWDILPPLIIVALFYLVIVMGLSKLLSIFERRLAKGDRN